MPAPCLSSMNLFQIDASMNPEDLMFSIRTILHPTDFSDFSKYSFVLACSFARSYGARLIVLHVARRRRLWPAAKG